MRKGERVASLSEARDQSQNSYPKIRERWVKSSFEGSGLLPQACFRESSRWCFRKELWISVKRSFFHEVILDNAHVLNSVRVPIGYILGLYRDNGK